MIFTWFCLVCLPLHITNSRTDESVKRFYQVSGQEINIRCSFPSSGGWKIFCWENCEEENNILIVTHKTSARSERYRIEYERGVLYVSISALTRSDSGRYRCGLWTYSSRYLYQDFELVVVEALLDGSKDHHLYKEAGSSLTVACFFGSDGRKHQFCRGECRKQVLIETDGDRAKTGRYSIEYVGGFLSVSISALARSDSGRYRCNLDVAYDFDPHRDFYLTVTDAVQPITTTTTATTTTATTTTATTTTATTTTATTTRSFSSSASSFTSSGSSAATNRSALADGDKSPPDVLLIVGLAFIFIIIMLTAALLVFCRNRSQNPEAPAVKTRKTPAVETNEVYEEIREDEMNSVPVRISTVYSCASFCKPAAADDVYSLAMAALPLDTAEDDLTRPTYTQVNFLNRSSENQLRPSNDLVYSVPRVAVGSHVGGESLYSNTA